MPQTRMMLRALALTLVMLCSFHLTAQVGIGTTLPDASSALEVLSNNTGVLIPRVALTSATDNTTISNPANYLMVFNTQSTSTLSPGLVYWKDGSWLRVLNTSDSTLDSTKWSLSGNSVTSSQFLGTTNSQALLLKTKSRQVAAFGIPADSITANTSANATAVNAIALGYNTKVSSNSSIAFGTKSTIGNSASNSILLGNNTTINHAYAVALGNNITTNSDYAVAIGQGAYVNGDRSVAIGKKSKSNSWDNVAVGNEATVTNSGATALGAYTSAGGLRSTVIGYGASTTQSRAIILGDNSSSTKIGIGTSSPSEKLEVQGSLKLVDGTQGNGKVLVSDANGKASWADASTISSGSSSGWHLTGNNDATSSSFVGTTNWMQLNLKAASTTMAQFHPNGSVGIGRNITVNGSYHSFAIGEGADASSAQDAYAFGTSAKASGYQSTAIGIESLATNNNAVAIGTSSEVTSQNAMALGYNATTSGQNSIAIGADAVADNPNTIILGNTSSDSWYRTKVAVGTTNPTANFEVKGTMKYVDGNQGAGKLLVSDADGNAKWVDANLATGGGSAVFGEIYSTSTTEQSITWNNSAQPLNFGSSSNISNVTATSTSLQPSVSGLYRATFTVSLKKGSGNSIDIKVYLATGWDSSDIIPGSSAYISLDSNSTNKTITINKFVHLDAYDQIYVFYEKVGGNTNSFYVLPEGSTFNIELLNYNF